MATQRIDSAVGRPRCALLLPDTRDAGAENQARFLLEGLIGAGTYDVELVYFGEGRAHALFAALGIPLWHVPRKRRLLIDLPGRARRLRGLFGAQPPDLLHTWLLEGNIVGLLAARAWPSTRVVISQRGSWNELDYRLHTHVQRALIGRADHAISNSPGGAEVLQAMRMPPEKVTVIPNGIPLERVRVHEDRGSIRSRFGWGQRPLIAWMGRADDRATMAQKDFGTLLAALGELRRSHPDALLVLVGPTSDQLSATGFELPDWATAIGWQERPADFLNAADLVAISSRAEGDSNVAGEALRLGLPIVTTDCGGHCDAVRQSGGGVVPRGDPITLAKAMESTLSDPPERIRVRGIAENYLSTEHLVASTTTVYDEVLR